MTTTLFRNLDIVTLDDVGNVFYKTDLLVDEGRIAKIGKLPEDIVADEVVDGSNRVAMPGFFNAHCHTPMSLLRGWAEEGYATVFDWLQRVWKAETHMTPDHSYWGAALSLVEMIRGGTIAFGDMYLYMDRIAEVVYTSGMKAALAWGFFTPGEGVESPTFEQTVKWVKEISSSGNQRITPFIGPHAPYTVSKDLLKQSVDVAHELGHGIHIHLSEDQSQVEQSLQQHGLRPVQYLDTIGIFDVQGGCIAAHTLYVDEKDIEILVKKGVYVAHCPITYARIMGAFPSLKPCLDAGVKLCLATDGPASNSDLDMFAVMRSAVLLHRQNENDPTMFCGDQALRLATQCGARAMGFKESGVLRVGAPADLILVNQDVPHMQPVHDLIANVVHSAKSADVSDVMVDGQWLMRNCELVTLDEDKILYEAKTHAGALIDRASQSSE